jgi:SAM-dependent methyltransferase
VSASSSHEGLTEVARAYGTDPGWLLVRVEDLFGSSVFAGLRVLDVGAGRGLHTCAMAALGAREVVALEPDLDGSRGGTASRLEDQAQRLRLTNVRVVRAPLQDFRAEPGSFDRILLYAVVNHLDETHVQTLAASEESRARFLSLLRPLRKWLQPRGELVLFDAARHHALEPLIRAGLLRRHPLAPTIEWEKHQEPEVWAALLQEIGFSQVRFHWAAFSRHAWVRRLLGGRFWASLISPRFVLRAWP